MLTRIMSHPEPSSGVAFPKEQQLTQYQEVTKYGHLEKRLDNRSYGWEDLL